MQILYRAGKGYMQVAKLNYDQIVFIHERVAEEAKLSGDPISPPGVKTPALLESSIGVQSTGYQGSYKYICPLHNVAALTYSLTTNHAFHNGNKRTALVSMMAHLYLNKKTLSTAVREEHLFCLFVCCASHRLNEFHQCKTSASLSELKKTIETYKGDYVEAAAPAFKNMDKEVDIIKAWIEGNSEDLEDDQTERKITIKQLQAILAKYNFVLEYNFKTQWMTFKKKTKILLFYTTSEYGRMWIRVPVPEKKMSKKDLSKIRTFLKLTQIDGYSAKSFYNGEDEIEYDQFIKKYRNVLRELSHF